MSLTDFFHTICIVSILRCQVVSLAVCLLMHALFDGQNVTITFRTLQNPAYGHPQISEGEFRCEWTYNTSTNTYICVIVNYSQTHSSWVRVEYGPCTSQWVLLDLTARPALGPRQHFDGCQDCLVASIGEKKVISCSLSTYRRRNVTITINNKTLKALQNSTENYEVLYTVKDIDHMASVVCTITSEGLTLIDTTRLYVKGSLTSQLPFSTHVVSIVGSPKPTKSGLTLSATINEQSKGTMTIHLPFSTHVVSKVGSPKTTKSALTISTPIRETSTGTLASQLPFSTHVVSVVGSPKTTKSALKISTPITEPSTATTHSEKTIHRGVDTANASTNEPSTKQDKPTAQGEVLTENTEIGVLSKTAKMDGQHLIIIACVCGVCVTISVAVIVIVVLFVTRKGQTTERSIVQNTTARGQIVEEEGYASIDGAECQYAVVNKPTTLLTTKPILAPPVENKSMEIQPQPNVTTPGAGELIYIDLDLEALSAKPTHPKTAGTLQRPSTPTEYVDIDFARTLALALEDANTDDK